MKTIKSILLIVILLFGIKIGIKIQHKWVIQKSIESNVVVEGWGTIETSRGDVNACWAGSGVIINSNGLIVTAKHILENADKIRITLFSGEQFIINNWKISNTDDFGCLTIPKKTPNYRNLVDSSFVKSGNYIYHIGNFSGILDNTFIEGKVIKNNFNRCFIEKYGKYFIFSNLKIQGGCSGGGVYTKNGCLIGIVVMNRSGATFIVPSTIILSGLSK